MNDDLHSLASEYVVGALADDEAQRFEAHLETCADCRAEVAEMRDVAVQLSAAVATDPPPRLRAAILEQIANTAQDAPPGAGVTAAAGGASGASNVIPMQRSPQRTRIAGLLAAAALLVAVAMGGWAIHSHNEAQQATAAKEHANAQAQQLTQVLAAKDVQTASGDFGTGGNGTVVVSKSQRSALLVTSGLPTLPSDKVYEAWTIKQSPRPAGTFSAGSAQSVLSLPAEAVTADQVAVTVEPSGGSSKPTTNPVFAVTLPGA
jgi:anti-sigma-K factor RskA